VPPSLTDSLEEQKKILQRQIYPLRDEPWFEALLPGVDPALDAKLAKALSTAFQRSPEGRLEALRMEVDLLRRLQHGRETERVFRPFGVLYLITPVRHEGQTLFALHSGPIKIDPWQSRELDTLAKLCNCRVPQLPPGLEQATVYNSAQIEHLVRLQQSQAHILESAIAAHRSASVLAPQSPAAPSAALDALQPGFADHLDLLFQTIDSQIRPGVDVDIPARRRIQAATERGRHLLDQLRLLSRDSLTQTGDIDIHPLLSSASEALSTRNPGLRFDLKLNARRSIVHSHPQALQHLLHTLLGGVADGLPPSGAFIGISTRDAEHDGRPCLHLEIRDGGGLATFAGIGGPLDHEILAEQNDDAEYADWVLLAERIDAHLRILRDDRVVTRVEVFLPLESAAIADEDQGPRPTLWIVEDDDRDFDMLRHMLQDAGVRIVRLRGGSELREQYTLSPAIPDLVLLKFNLPDARGNALRLWLYEQDPALPVILVSGLATTHPGIATAAGLPATLFLQKPFDARTLIDMLRMTLRDTMPG
jgi:CheY-like chemotaxis protein